MNKPLLIVVGIIVVAVVGYLVFASRPAPTATGNIPGIPDNTAADNQSLIIPQTEEQKLDVLNNLTQSADVAASPASESAKERALNSAASSPKSDTIPAGDAEKIKLLESLKK